MPLLSPLPTLRPPRHFDVTAVEDICLTAVAGRDAWRRARPQTVSATVRIAVDTEPAALNDDLALACDYSPLVRAVVNTPLAPFEHPVDLAQAVHTQIAASLVASARRGPKIVGVEVVLLMPKAVHLANGGLLVRYASGHLVGDSEKLDCARTEGAPLTLVAQSAALRGIVLSVIVGVGPFERIQAQAVSVDIDVHGCANVDFNAIVMALSRVAASSASHSRLTLETLAREMIIVALRVVRRARLPNGVAGNGAVSIRLCKPGAVQVARHAVIEITRDQEWLRSQTGDEDESESTTDDDEAAAGETVFLALGSNSGDRSRNIDTGLSAVAALDGVRLCDTSFLYETKPMYFLEQDRFFNAVCKVRKTHSKNLNTRLHACTIANLQGN